MRLKFTCKCPPVYQNIIHGRILCEVKGLMYGGLVVAVLSAQIRPILYMGRFYVRSEVTHKIPPGYYAGSSPLYGKILCKNFDLM